MGQTAIISPQIIDSTTVGRDLITAADAAAGRAVLELEDASYNWTADHVFEGSIEATNYAFTTGVDGQLSHPDLGNSIYVRFNNADVFRFNALDFWPVANGTKNLGRSDHEWANVYSVDGNFSGRVLTTRLENVDGLSYIRVSGGTTSPIKLWRNTAPQGDNAFDMGADAERFRTVYSVDGSYSGNLNIEVSGSQRLYNLGTDGDTDTEYLETSWSSGRARVQTQATGSGTVNSLDLKSGNSYVQLNDSNDTLKLGTLASTLTVSNTYFNVNRNFYSTADTNTCGLSTNRWGNVYSVDGDFSGDVVIDGQITNTDANNLLPIYFSGTEQYSFRSNALVPKGTAKSSGLSAARWTNTYSANGSFSGNLNTEVGGTQRVYGLGTEGDPDTHYLQSEWDGSFYRIGAKATGAGSNQSLMLDYGGSSRLFVSSSEVRIYKYLRPSDTTIDIGSVANPFRTVYSVAGNFSGTITNSATTGWSATFSRGINVGADSGINWFYSDGNQTKFSTGVFFEGVFQFGRAADGISSRVYKMKKDAGYFNFAPVDGGVSGDTIFRVEDDTDTFQPIRTGGYVNHYIDKSGQRAYRMYNLGEAGDTDTEYGGFDFTSNVFRVGTQTTASGVARDVGIIRDGSWRMYFGSSNATIYQSLVPNSTGALNLGSTTLSFARTFSQAVFSGIQTITAASDTLVTTDTTNLCDCTSNAIAITIPTSSSDYVGNEYVIKKIDSSANAVTITPTSRTIDGAASATITTQYESVTLVSDGTNWFIV